MTGLTAHADEDGYRYATSDWKTVDTASDGTPTSPSAKSTIVDKTTTHVTWDQETGETSAAGTSIQTSNLGIRIKEGDKVTVNYKLDGTDPVAGSIRLFVYYSVDADTWSQRPDQQAVVGDVSDAVNQQLEIEVDQEGTIGTAGIVYDTSNGGVTGTVEFTKLKVDKKKDKKKVVSSEPKEDDGGGDEGGGDEVGDAGGDEGGTEEGGDAGTETGTEEGGDHGTENGDDKGGDDKGGDAGGKDDGKGDDDGEALPDTGAGVTMGLVFGVLALLAGGYALLMRNRRNAQSMIG